ncbi:uncharacterized protein NECHADRAFT_88540 [Fusarium vanettenii 77-13-4]|uniref:Uncharacterized protein n=1 Tax=Fusarium vanettenii (strain ATCC MYA-4622 / CBS 123669 / FGSC 9596 / NRRL 45880 / 77-13-4) TaxID=660122 RepID=C7ZBT7_FUSV7|nr:uncharacterized protein NECHADRAFT_88540 [Fusarium vanettenii 77-13-4]EEU38425.1 predicted protein [Fusarium vanettenii 77-13-4]
MAYRSADLRVVITLLKAATRATGRTFLAGTTHGVDFRVAVVLLKAAMANRTFLAAATAFRSANLRATASNTFLALRTLNEGSAESRTWKSLSSTVVFHMLDIASKEFVLVENHIPNGNDLVAVCTEMDLARLAVFNHYAVSADQINSSPVNLNPKEGFLLDHTP